MANSQHKDKTIGHIHTDPKLIQQTNCKNTLKIGMLVYVDPYDELYKPALSTPIEITSNVLGVVWGFVGANKFYLRTLPGPMEYRFPLTKDYFNMNGKVIDELSPNNDLIPGDLGDRLWLSETQEGRMQSTKPLGGNITLMVGYKTKYGFVYQPKYICCYLDSV
jgi:hypothetical protein